MSPIMMLSDNVIYTTLHSILKQLARTPSISKHTHAANGIKIVIDPLMEYFQEWKSVECCLVSSSCVVVVYVMYCNSFTSKSTNATSF